ncbi:MAG: hypothetical protein JRJ49_09700 [Deltaproteobacteria bacterium]|nr:hypothetical protein [Deltaproteobacteria bacterium]
MQNRIDKKADEEKRKKLLFDAMAEKRQKYILKKGYDKWDPFQEPKDPIDIRKDKTKRTSQMLIREFLQSRANDKNYNNSYARGALELCLGIINEEPQFQGMYDFACWYKELLTSEGIEIL